MIEIKSGKQIYTGFENMELVSSMNFLCSGFRIAYSAGNEHVIPFENNSLVSILLSSKKVFEGYINTSSKGSKKGIDIILSGRSKTCDLLDCSAKIETFELNKVTLKDIAESLALKYGIKVLDEKKDTFRFPKWSVRPGETNWENLERAARQRAAVITTNQDGDLLITKVNVGRADVDLVQGVNIKGWEDDTNGESLFSEYEVTGQSPEYTDASGVAKSSAIGRFRNKTVLSETLTTPETAKLRAEWEKTISEQRAKNLRILHDGWHQTEKGRLWEKNESVNVKIPSLKIKKKFLITGVTFRLSKENGEETLIELEPEDSFQVANDRST